MAEAEKVRRIYDRVARTYDARSDASMVDKLRAHVFSRARGDVLELGVGTGASFVHYPTTVTSLTALDISPAMVELAKSKTHGLQFPVQFMLADFQTLAFPAASFDTVVTSLALCGIPDPARLFAEIKRVLRPGGQLLAVEHIRPPNPILGVLADIASPINNHFIGCYLNRRTPDLLREAGFSVQIAEQRFFKALVALTATPRPAGAV